MTGQEILSCMTEEARAALDPETRRALEENRVVPIEGRAELPVLKVGGDLRWRP